MFFYDDFSGYTNGLLTGQGTWIDSSDSQIRPWKVNNGVIEGIGLSSDGSIPPDTPVREVSNRTTAVATLDWAQTVAFVLRVKMVNPGTRYRYLYTALDSSLSAVTNVIELLIGDGSFATTYDPSVTPALLSSVFGGFWQGTLNFTLNEWHEIILRYNGTVAGTITLLFDGVVVDTVAVGADLGDADTHFFFRSDEKTTGTGDSEIYVQSVGITYLPAAPTIGTATASGTSITLTWSDNSDNESGFEIDYDTANTFDVAMQTTTAAVGAESKTISGLNPETQYFFRVRATNAAGDSANTATASATTEAAASGSAAALLAMGIL